MDFGGEMTLFTTATTNNLSSSFIICIQKQKKKKTVNLPLSCLSTDKCQTGYHWKATPISVVDRK